MAAVYPPPYGWAEGRVRHAWTVAGEFLIARNPDPDSALPFIVRFPLGGGEIVLKARDSWPRTTKVYCHRDVFWPDDAEVLERVQIKSATRRGAAIDLVLDRSRESRSQFVITRLRGGREAIFWQSARTRRQARPNVTVPRARAHGLTAERLQVLIDSHEKYPWKFADRQVTTRRQALPVGDYAVQVPSTADGPGGESSGEPAGCDGLGYLAVVERKSLEDLCSSLTGGRLKFAMNALADLPHAAVVVEARYSEVFKVTQVRPQVLADGLAECAARWPTVPILFCENRKLAQEWAFRFLGACLAQWWQDHHGQVAVAELTHQAGE